MGAKPTLTLAAINTSPIQNFLELHSLAHFMVCLKSWYVRASSIHAPCCNLEIPSVWFVFTQEGVWGWTPNRAPGAKCTAAASGLHLQYWRHHHRLVVFFIDVLTTIEMPSLSSMQWCQNYKTLTSRRWWIADIKLGWRCTLGHVKCLCHMAHRALSPKHCISKENWF